MDELLSAADGTTKVIRARDGSVFVYDERRETPAPGTRRTRVLATGETDVPDFLALS